MRFMMKVVIPVETGNAAAKAGKLGQTIQSILEELKPESAYFTSIDGCRSGYFYFNMDDASQIPSIAEPWFLAFNASVDIHPVMLPEDLGKASGSIQSAVDKYS
jgi:hypothetical protein